MLKMLQPKISIISVFYNDKKMLELLINSVLDQDYENIEHIIIDGASTDGSLDILKEAESRYSVKKLKWISEKDNGISDAVNKGFALMEGDYFVCMQDPYCHASVIKTMVQHLTRHNYDGCFGGIYFINSDKKIIRQWSGKGGNWRFGWMPATQTFCIRTKYYRKYGGYRLDYKASADYELQVRIFSNEKNLRLVSIREPLVLYFAGGISNSGIKGNWNSIKESYHALRENKIKFSLFTISCKIIIAFFAYLFASKKVIVCNTERK